MTEIPDVRKPSNATELPTAQPEGRRKMRMNEISLFVAIGILYLVFAATAGGFMSFNNQISILRDAATIGIAAWAATLVIIAGEIDVSVGPMVAFTSVALAFLLQWGVPTPIGFVLAIGLGALIGSVAGVLRACFDVPSFVATLGLWSALRGTALFVTDALPVSIGRNEMVDMLDRPFFPCRRQPSSCCCSSRFSPLSAGERHSGALSMR